jgi:hypothetical protein
MTSNSSVKCQCSSLQSTKCTYTDGSFDMSVKAVKNFFNNVINFGQKIASLMQSTE